MQLANGFTLRRLIPDYLPSDQDSRGYATFLEWINLDYVKDRRRRFRARLDGADLPGAVRHADHPLVR